MMLEKYCKDNGYEIYDYYIDDGYSGLNYNRPNFQRMLQDIENGKIDLVITKDLSRLGRDYIMTGYYTEIYFNKKGNRLSTYGNNISFKYDLSGMRISKLVGNELHKYYIHNGNILREEVTNSITGSAIYTLDFYYDETGVCSFNYNSTMYYYQKDLTGSIIGVYNDFGSIVAKYRYDAWGNHKVYDQLNQETTLKTFIGNINPFRYRGYYYDVETGLFMMGRRYYSPELCRFIQPAEVSSLNPYSINGLNMFSYGKNNPINNSYINNKLNYNSSFRIYTKLLNRLSAHLMFSDFDYAKNHRNPNRGAPNSIGRIFYPDGSPKQEREYGPDGRPVVDHDHHPGEDVGYDHDHDWDWDKNPPRQPAREPSKVLAALGIIGTGVALIWLAGNDVTGYGAADDWLIPAVATSFVAFWAILFNEGEDNTW